MLSGLIDSLSMVSQEGIMVDCVVARFVIPRSTQGVNPRIFSPVLRVGRGIIEMVMGIQEGRSTNSTRT